MNDPLDSDDDWAALARELDRDKPPVPERTEALRPDLAEDVSPGDLRAEEDAEGESEATADEEFEDAEEGPAGETGEPTTEGEQPGTGRKRRRRRRRRRKGGAAPVEGAAVGTASSVDAEEEGEGEAELSAEIEEEPVGAGIAESDEFDAPTEDGDADLAPLSAEEDTANEVLRDLIDHWNVPSWDEIVSGLYRPG